MVHHGVWRGGGEGDAHGAGEVWWGPRGRQGLAHHGLRLHGVVVGGDGEEGGRAGGQRQGGAGRGGRALGLLEVLGELVEGEGVLGHERVQLGHRLLIVALDELGGRDGAAGAVGALGEGRLGAAGQLAVHRLATAPALAGLVGLAPSEGRAAAQAATQREPSADAENRRLEPDTEATPSHVPHAFTNVLLMIWIRRWL